MSTPTGTLGSGDLGNDQGLALLSLPGVKALQSYLDEEHPLAAGQLNLLLVTVQRDPFSDATTLAQSSRAQDADALLVLTISQPRNRPDGSLAGASGASTPSDDDFSYALTPAQRIHVRRESRTTSYVLPADEVPGASIQLRLPYGTEVRPSAEVKQLVEELDEILAQYAQLDEQPADKSGAKGKSSSSSSPYSEKTSGASSSGQPQIELIDDEGNVVGSIEGSFDVQEDKSLAPGASAASAGRTPTEGDVVLLDLQEKPPTKDDKLQVQGSSHQLIQVRPMSSVPAQEQDWILRGAGYVTAGIVRGSELLGSAMQGAANSYIQRTKVNSAAASHTADKYPYMKDDLYGEATGSEKDSSQTMAMVPAQGSHAASTATPAPSGGAVDTTPSGHTPLRFSASTHRATQLTDKYAARAVKLSSKTAGTVLKVANNLGTRLGGGGGGAVTTSRNGKASTAQYGYAPGANAVGFDAEAVKGGGALVPAASASNPTAGQGSAGTSGPPPVPPRGGGVRGALSRGVVAASMVLDGLEQGAGRLLNDGGDAAGRAIGHRFGDEARVVGGRVGGVGKGVFLVYRDINGLRRRCMLKAAKGVLRARLVDGRVVTVVPDQTSEANPHLVGAPPSAPSTWVPGAHVPLAGAAASTHGQPTIAAAAASSGQQDARPPPYAPPLPAKKS